MTATISETFYFGSGKPFLAVSYPHDEPKKRGVWKTFIDQESALKWLYSRKKKGYPGEALITSLGLFNLYVETTNKGKLPGSLSLLAALHHYAMFTFGVSADTSFG